MNVTFIGQKQIPVSELKPHPENPNRGDVNSIAESLEQFGQYRSVVALEDMTLLAGHHVVQAAKNIGLKTVRVDVVKCDPKTARKIMLADNRIPELGLGADFEMLLKNLEAIDGDFEGTGFDADYQRLLEEAVNGPPEPDEPDPDEGGGSSGFRTISLSLEAILVDHWAAHRKLFPDDSAALRYLLG